MPVSKLCVFFDSFRLQVFKLKYDCRLQNLDVQYTIGVASGVPTVFISVGDDSTDGVFGFLDTANHLLAETTPPHVMTTSYGSDESDISRSLAK